MMQHLLTALIFLPVLAALLALFIPSGNKKLFQYGALVVSLLQVLLLFLIIQSYGLEDSAFRLTEKYSWITLDMGTWGLFQAQYKVSFYIFIDGERRDDSNQHNHHRK